MKKTATNQKWKPKTALFLSGQCLSVLGSSMVQYAIMWYLILESNSGLMMTLYVLVGFLPHAFLAPIGGVLADRFPRKKVIILADSAVALVTLGLAILFSQGNNSYGLLLGAAFLRTIGGSIQTPAINAVLPQIVPKEKLMRVGGINSSLLSMIYILSPAFGGLLLSLFDIVSIFYVDIFTAVIAIAILAKIPIPPHEKATVQQKGSYLKELLQGFHYVKNHKTLWQLLFFYTVFCFLIAPASYLAPIYITRTFGDAVWMLMVQEICFSGGAILGSLILSLWGGFKNRITTICVGTVLYGIFTFALGGSPWLFLFYGIALCIGLSLPLCNTTINVYLQESVDENILGRVFGLVSVVGSAGVPLGMLLFGPLSDFIDIRIIFYICGIALSVFGIGFLLYQKKNNKKQRLS